MKNDPKYVLLKLDMHLKLRLKGTVGVISPEPLFKELHDSLWYSLNLYCNMQEDCRFFSILKSNKF